MKRSLIFVLFVILMGCAETPTPIHPQGAETQGPPKGDYQFYGTGSHGSDDAPQAVALFANGKRTIQFCLLEESPLVESAFQKGFHKVASYYLEKKVHEWLPPEKRLATRVALVENCDNADLKIIRENQSQHLIDEKLTDRERAALSLGKKSLQKPLSFLFRTDDPSEARTWGAALLWIADRPWTYAELAGVLAHESGHAFGVPHTGGTALARSFGGEWIRKVARLEMSDKEVIESYLQIDDTAELFFCRSSSCQLKNYHGQLGLTVEMAQKNFQTITGRTPIGDIQSKIYIRRIPKFKPTRSLFPLSGIIWAGTLSDSVSQFPFLLEVDITPYSFHLPHNVFNNPWGWAETNYQGSQFQGRLHTHNNRIPIQIDRNLNLGAPLSVPLAIRDEHHQFLFLSHTLESRLNTRHQPKADLSIESVTVTNGTAQVTVRNEGSVPSFGNNLLARHHQKWLGTTWVDPLAPGEERTLPLSLTGQWERHRPWEANVVDLGHGKNKIRVNWNGHRVDLFRNQLYLPEAWTRPNHAPRYPVEIRVDAYNSVMESNESNNVVVLLDPMD